MKTSKLIKNKIKYKYGIDTIKIYVENYKNNKIKKYRLNSKKNIKEITVKLFLCKLLNIITTNKLCL